ncbi:hypothetical protein A5699_04310 [Mycobacterium sp. E802]|uniref:hypothetical protein n=1 Tax=Mycobacterium sp. E802 TaxID=1834152 RepID=UPI0007FCE3C7|nr:hypothetical protein [Mycobacterium sp. E802]OBG83402.1 hypothetical protein A5699_04310 [Mycobacterium sp. E802]
MSDEPSTDGATTRDRRLPRGVRIADITACVLLFLIQAGLAVVALMSFMVFPMSIDNCAYVACGDELVQGGILGAAWHMAALAGPLT